MTNKEKDKILKKLESNNLINKEDVGKIRVPLKEILKKKITKNKKKLQADYIKKLLLQNKISIF